jgi:hypothetical protein
MRTTASRNLRTLASIQVLSGIIGCLCIAFLIISILYSFSSQNFIDRLSFQPWPKNIYRKTNANKQKPIIDTISLNNESFICDYVKSNNESDTKSSLSFEKHRLNALRRKYSTFCFSSYRIGSTYVLAYCDFLPIPQKKWVPARRYKESDIVFVIFTAASFYHGRATSIRDTWLSRVTNKYFFSATPYPTLPVTVIKGVGEGYTSNMKKAYIGMQLAYQEHNQTAKFYFLAGCDTFVNIPHILKRLDGFDYTQPLVIGGYPFKHVCYHKKEQTPDVIVYPSGGAGFLLSARMMEMMYPKLTDFFEEDWPIIDVPYNDGKEFFGLFSIHYSFFKYSGC